MPGPVALVGAGEFLPAMAEFDAGLLAATGRARPRVAILPTASYPDGEEVFTRWAAMGVAHFGELGAEVEPVLVRDRAGADDPAAAQAIGEADLVYLSGGKPATCWACSTGAPSAGRWSRRTSAARSSPAARPGRWSWPATCFDFRVRAGALAAALAGRPRVRRGRVGPAALRRLAGAVVGAHRAPGAARLGGPGDRRGDRGRRPRRRVAGPRPVARDGLARPPPRAVPRRRDVPGLAAGTRRGPPARPDGPVSPG